MKTSCREYLKVSSRMRLSARLVMHCVISGVSTERRRPFRRGFTRLFRMNMKRILLLLFVGLVVGSGPVVRSQQGGGIGPGTSWQRYTVKDEEFSVTLPRLPEMTITQAPRKSDGKVRYERNLRVTFANINFVIDALEN